MDARLKLYLYKYQYVRLEYICGAFFASKIVNVAKTGLTEKEIFMGYMVATGFCLAMLFGAFFYEARRLKKEQLYYRVKVDSLLKVTDSLPNMHTWGKIDSLITAD